MAGWADFALACSAMAVSASRTFAKVKSSAITPRQPEVPNLTGEVVCNPALVLMARYFSPSRNDTKVIIMRASKIKKNEPPKSTTHSNRSCYLPDPGHGAQDRARRG